MPYSLPAGEHRPFAGLASRAQRLSETTATHACALLSSHFCKAQTQRSLYRVQGIAAVPALEKLAIA
jgi:hypothetical protein